MTHLKEITPEWVKIPTRRLRTQYQRVTSRSRALPDFIIIGAQKAGTSSLYTYLSQHPQLLASFKKEVHFFDGGINPTVDNYKKGDVWYRSHFPLKKNVAEQMRVFEASPLYIFNPLVPARIANLLPNVKIIVLLRNPTERAISQYFHEKKLGREFLSIEEAFQNEEERMSRALKNQDYKSNDFICHSYRSRGLYKEQLDRYFKYFNPDQFSILNSESFFSNPEETLRQVFEFVDVNPNYRVPDLKPRMVGKNRKTTSLAIKNELDSFFAPYNQELYKLVGEDYGW